MAEDERLRLNNISQVIRQLLQTFRCDDRLLGLYGAFAYDLALQFEPLRLHLERPNDQRDLVLYLPDEILVVDHRREAATLHTYEFDAMGASTRDAPRDGECRPSFHEPAQSDLPADDGNPCTEAACDIDAPSHPPVIAGKTCGADGVCNGTGICGVCVPKATQCTASQGAVNMGDQSTSPMAMDTA